MAKIIKLSPHIANLIAAGEVVERPASVVKELLENAVDAGATQVTIELRDGGMTFIRVTDNGCGMSPEDARTAFLRHATSKLRAAEDLAAIHTMGFRGEALAAIASVSRIDLMTKTSDSVSGTSIALEAGNITDESEVGCPDGTTIIIRDLFFNTPARMKFMKTDSYEGSKVADTVQMQALAHPEVAFRFLRDGKEALSTPGSGNLQDAMYSIYGRECSQMVAVDSTWENCKLKGFVSKPSDSRPSRSRQVFFVNDRPVRSPMLIKALEEAYRNQIMIGKFPACVLHLTIPAGAVDVNVHPAKTEVKFLQEKVVFDCVHYGVLGGLNKAADRPQMQFKTQTSPPVPAAPAPKVQAATSVKNESFFRTMTAKEYQQFSSVIASAPQPKKEAAGAVVSAISERRDSLAVQETIQLPKPMEKPVAPAPVPPVPVVSAPIFETSAPKTAAVETPVAEAPMEQIEFIPQETPWRMVGELYNSYILVEQGEDAFFIDKHAAHERILFEKLKANQESISSQSLLTPIPCHLNPSQVAILLEYRSLLEELGFEIDEFGEGTLLLRQIPMDLSPDDGADALESLASDLQNGRREDKDSVRDEVLHTVACKAAIKAGWHTSEPELLALVKKVMNTPDLKHCPHGRPICISLSKKQLEKQFKR